LPPHETFNEVRKIAANKMTDILSEAIQHMPNPISDTVPFLNIIISTFVNNHLIFEDASYNYRYGKKGRIIKDSVQNTEKDIVPGEAFSNFFGSYDLSKRFFSFIRTPEGKVKISNVHFEVDGNPDFKLHPIENLVYYLIYKQSKMDSVHVGGPISVLLFDKNGPHWKYNSLHCY
jgi:hypothetical protein